MKRVFFYSSVKSKKQFSRQEFYKNDIKILKSLGFRVTLSNHWYDFLLFWRYDIAFIYFFRYGFICGLLAKIFLKRVFYTGGIDFLDRRFANVRQFLIQSIFYNACGFVANAIFIVSVSDYNNCERVRYVFKKSKQLLCHNCINFPAFDAQGSSKIDAVTTIAWMGRKENVVRKGVCEALLFFSLFLKKMPNFKLFIIGPTGEGTILVRKCIDNLGIEDSVIITGSLPEKEKNDILRASKIYLQFSRYEGLGLAAIEALAAGCLVVHSNAGGLSEGVGNHGLIWSPGNEEPVIGNILDILGDNQKYENIVSNGKGHVSSKFSIESRRIIFRNHILG